MESNTEVEIPVHGYQKPEPIPTRREREEITAKEQKSWERRDLMGRLAMTFAAGLALFGGAKGREAIASSTVTPPVIEPPTSHLEVSGLPSAEVSRDYEELANYIFGRNTQPDSIQSRWLEERGLTPEDIKFVIIPHAGRVVSQEGLKVRFFPDTDPRFGFEAPREKWLSQGEEVSWPHEVRIRNKEGGLDRWGAVREVKEIVVGGKKGEITHWEFFAVEVNGQTFVELLSGVTP